ncbi:MAG: ferrochelatase [Deltaproteobacteria bacterium]
MSVLVKKAFLLLAFGGAASLSDVGPFVKRILGKRPVADEFIKKAEDRYRLIGGISPLVGITKDQAQAIRGALARQGLTYMPYVGMRFSEPFIKDTVRDMKNHGIERAAAVIMSPFTSPAATGGYVKDIEDALAECGGMAIDFIEGWHVDRLFIEAVLRRIKHGLKSLPQNDLEKTTVIFSFHSLPVDALRGDPYEDKIRRSVQEIVKSLDIDYKIAYQSKGGGGMPWLGPDAGAVIAGAADEGRKAVLVVPLGFTSDHVETLYDIDIVLKEIAEARGLMFKRTPSFNASEDFISLLSGLIKSKLA